MDGKHHIEVFVGSDNKDFRNLVRVSSIEEYFFESAQTTAENLYHYASLYEIGLKN